MVAWDYIDHCTGTSERVCCMVLLVLIRVRTTAMRPVHKGTAGVLILLLLIEF